MSETSLPTAQPPSRQAARVPPPDGQQGRAGRAEGAPPEGPAASGSLTWTTRGRSVFNALKQARTLRSGPLTLACLPGLLPPPRLAYAIGKTTGNAVVRNRLRRRLREAVRHAPGLPPGTYLVRVRPQAVELSFWDLQAHFTSLAKQARRQYEAQPRAATTVAIAPSSPGESAAAMRQ